MVEGQVHAVIDNGTGYMKAGFSGEEAPRTVFPTMIGIPNEGAIFGTEKKQRLFGEEAFEKYGISKTLYPIENGVITKFEEMELLWNHILFSELRIDPSQHNILLTDAPLNSEENREKMVEIMFEKFDIPGLFISNSSVMSVYSTGRTLAMIIDSGHEVTNFVPLYEGFAYDHAILKTNYGGKTLTNYLVKLLLEKKYVIDTSAKLLKINDIKEKYCCVSYDYDTEIKEIDEANNLEAKIKLPDGEEIRIDYERLKVPEILFKSSIADLQYPGIHEQCFASIQKIDAEIRKDLYSNIVLAGGNTLFQGFPERITKEIQKLTPSATAGKVKIIALPERKYSAWIGGSIFSALSSFQCMWITKAEYEEEGAKIVHKKCF